MRTALNLCRGTTALMVAAALAHWGFGHLTPCFIYSLGASVFLRVSVVIAASEP